MSGCGCWTAASNLQELCGTFIRNVLRRTLRAAALALAAGLALAGPASAVDGFNLPGSDYANFPASSTRTCQNTCGGDSRCQAWTWVRPGIQGPAGRCWLKYRLPTLVKDRCCASGPRAYIEPADMRAEDRTDRPGRDYRNFATNSWTSCQATCNAESRCAAWTYARRGAQGPTGRCWLKGAVPFPVDNAQTVSGVKFRRASVMIDPGTNLVPANE